MLTESELTALDDVVVSLVEMLEGWDIYEYDISQPCRDAQGQLGEVVFDACEVLYYMAEMEGFGLGFQILSSVGFRAGLGAQTWEPTADEDLMPFSEGGWDQHRKNALYALGADKLGALVLVASTAFDAIPEGMRY